MSMSRAEKKLYTVKEVADILGMHPNTIYIHISHGLIKTTRFGRKIVISASEIERLIREGYDTSGIKDK